MARKKIVDSLRVEAIDFGGMFPFILNIVYKKGTTIEKIVYEAALKDENLVPLANSMEGATPLSMVYNLDGTTVVYMFMDDSISLDTIVHESAHVVCRLFEIIGSNINEETEEFFAYIQTDVFKRVYKTVTQKFQLDPPVLYEE